MVANPDWGLTGQDVNALRNILPALEKIKAGVRDDPRYSGQLPVIERVIEDITGLADLAAIYLQVQGKAG
jgi:hypothetical protein